MASFALFVGGLNSALADPPAGTEAAASASASTSDAPTSLPEGSVFSSLQQSFNENPDLRVVRGHFDLGSPPNVRRYYCLINTKTGNRETNGVLGELVPRAGGMTGIKNIAVSLYSCADAQQQGMLVTTGYELSGLSGAANGAKPPARHAKTPAEPSTPPPVPAAHTNAQQAHEEYTSAINSNDLQALLAMFTEDVVLLSPNEPALVGKAAVRAWSEAYLKAFTIHWDKAVSEFTAAGDWAFERYSYRENDTPRGGGAAVTDTGKGLIIYHRDSDGKWRVARDAWNSDLPLPTK